MPIPLIPIIIGAGSALLGALGIKKGLDANENFDKAKSKGERATLMKIPSKSSNI